MIIDAAERQISELGFKSFTLSRLAEDCEMTRKGVEHYFATKEEILIAVLRHRDAVDVQSVRPTGILPTDEPGMWAALDAVVARNARRPEIIRLYTVLDAEALDPSHPAYDYFAERLVRARTSISVAVQTWHPDPDAFAISVLSFMDGLQLQWLRDPSLDLVALWKAASATLRRVTDRADPVDSAPDGTSRRVASRARGETGGRVPAS